MISDTLNRIFPRGSFLKGAAALISGNVAGQAIVVLSSPVLTRLYTPDDFGVFGVYLASTAFFTLICSLRYELGIVLPKSDIIAKALLSLSLLLLFFAAAATFIGVYCFGETALQRTGLQAFEHYLWILPLTILVGGTHKAMSFWTLRNNAHGVIAKTRVQQDGGMVGSQLIFGYSQFGALGLLAGHLIGFTLALLSLLRYYARTKVKSCSRMRWKHVRYAAKRYIRFPLFTTWADMANVASKQLPLIMLAGLFSPSVAGYYVLAHRVANAPVAMISDGVGRAFMIEAARAQRESIRAD